VANNGVSNKGDKGKRKVWAEPAERRSAGRDWKQKICADGARTEDEKADA
jgi:hypothetical protein